MIVAHLMGNGRKEPLFNGVDCRDMFSEYKILEIQKLILKNRGLV